MSTEVYFLYMWFLTNDPMRSFNSSNTADAAIATLDDIASTSSDFTTGMWAQSIANFIRKYKV